MTSLLYDDLAPVSERVTVQTRFGTVRGGRTGNGAVVFLEVPYALPPVRFQDAEPLPPDYRYDEKDYIYESSYAAQPKYSGQGASSMPYEWLVGKGQPTENPLFVNITCPLSFPSETGFRVKVYIHGGFLQFGSPHGVDGRGHYIASERSEVHVNVGYRLSAFGFLACDQPRIDGNFGFKDQWLALLWIRDNIEAFGGNPSNIQVTGLSAGRFAKYCTIAKADFLSGAHSVHQLLHHASRLPKGQRAPFQSAMMHSNAIVVTPKTPEELRSQFHTLCRALNLDPLAPNILATLRDPSRVQWQAITNAIESGAVGAVHGTFRGCLDGSWMSSSPDPMTWQRSGAFARALRAKGVRSIVVGDLTEEWYLYGLSHPVHSLYDVKQNMARYYPGTVVEKMSVLYPALPDNAPEEECVKLFGKMLSDGQVHIPVRLLARDLASAGFPVVRYQIRWTPEQNRPLGYVSHGTDFPLWALHLPMLKEDQIGVARAWLEAISSAVAAAECGECRNPHEVLALNEDKAIGWKEDDRWDELMRLWQALPGEVDVWR
ncbi:carboxylesterase [Obba rivulosa]|uniref:Carboxylic ester hydrolase n=1 Tax=Obba rivulosa TaxID=1052685 RepID=A0A8E2ARV1_9APHY|nr:carboxylesterase [Obba rivulosa]